MLFDMHCHTREGSIDAKADLLSIAKKLKEKGFSGMLVTDHNSYQGYDKWLKKKVPPELEEFVILKGIEYDTSDAGHMLVILPDYIQCKLLELRGLTVEKLEKLVHSLGGIIGPAHPYGTGYFALMNNRHPRRHPKIIEKFDFIETYNTCNSPEQNEKAVQLAKKYGKPGFAGSDSHHLHTVGTAYTSFTHAIRNNNDLIRMVKDRVPTRAGLHMQDIIQKHTNLLLKYLGIAGYWVYNKTGAILRSPARVLAVHRHHEWKGKLWR